MSKQKNRSNPQEQNDSIEEMSNGHGAPNIHDLLTAPKTRIADGRGPGNRPWVFQYDKDGRRSARRPRQGDDVRPICPMCSTDDIAVLAGAYSSPSGGAMATTRYKCPLCTFSCQILRTNVADALMRRQAQAAGPQSPPFVQRPE